MSLTRYIHYLCKKMVSGSAARLSPCLKSSPLKQYRESASLNCGRPFHIGTILLKKLLLKHSVLQFSRVEQEYESASILIKINFQPLELVSRLKFVKNTDICII